MAEYIKREALVEALRKYQYPYGVEFLVSCQPAADVVEVVHGRWERTDDPEFYMGDFECSVCKHLECDIDTTCLMPGENCLYYCPNCGARMDGEG